ncbi:AraC family transcriptional regulator [Paenibacillus doosanensis]|uniref:HTH-type transcriptional activator Btr n=1 Tax=Paenibacillus konkukensis TaxID=2020716 RepID=A0ABY4RZY0_9BACL|nr:MULTISPECIES: AraC family transcriptional regulator [Paenibacillus]MCS7458591.1 AraC family transcriptional regulator [Paenibacillus doosanensis]UQZ86887.1 HTH-type transcriptional activator Btr [Paenibacillus konkukensis]
MNMPSKPAPGCSAPHIVIAGDFTVKAGWTLGPRALTDYELVYFPVGSAAEYRLDDRTFRLEEPCFILTRPAQTHTYRFDPVQPTRHLFVHFMMDTLTGSHDLSPLVSPDGPSYLPAGKASLLPSLLTHILHLAAARPPSWESRCNLLLYSLLAELEELAGSAAAEAEEANPLPPQIVKALQTIDQHLHLPLSVAAIADSVGWTHEHFTRIFVRHTGMTPQKAISERRIDRACQLLVQSHDTVKQIAFTVGFTDEHYFSRCFTRSKGMTASEYRERFSDPRAQHLAPAEAYRTPYPANKLLHSAQIK